MYILYKYMRACYNSKKEREKEKEGRKWKGRNIKCFFSKQVGVALFYYVFEERPPLTTNSRPPVLFIYFKNTVYTPHGDNLNFRIVLRDSLSFEIIYSSGEMRHACPL